MARKRRTRSERIKHLKDLAHRLLQKEDILQTKLSLMNNRLHKTHDKRVKIQEKFRKLEKEEE